jgi:light-regulated signal transduction histidine kinase (bacteriophytochrome)
LGENGTETIKLIRSNVEKMDTLVKAILRYSTIGRVEKDFYKVDSDQVLKKILNTIEVPNHITISIPEKLPMVTGDHFRLKELFLNMLNNAIKFNDKPQGKITIGYTDAINFWEFYVKDNGKGIEEKYFEKIFVAFQKLENDYKSTGIGLSIVKKIIELYKGEIWIESIPTQETTFYFTLKK